MTTGFKHIPIMVEEVLQHLVQNPSGIYVDGTLGGGGHSEKILESLASDGRLIGIDRDLDAHGAANERLARFGRQFQGVHGNFKDFEGHLDTLGIELVDGVLIDLGVSSYQLDAAHRGFSYNHDAPLDMRMNQKDGQSAYDVVNQYNVKELAGILRDYGEEKFAKSIANRIIAHREKAPIQTTKELAEIVKEGIPARARRTGGHPAKRTFQAIRIEVNQELEALSETVKSMIRRLHPGGRLCVITFHSLEDRIVKHAMRALEDPCICPSDIPVCVCGRISEGKMKPRKGVLPSEQEVQDNPRSRSARLRIFVREAHDLNK